MLELNQPTPDFTCLNQNEIAITLSHYQGQQNIVLYFYPKDDTPGCTTKATEFSALTEEFSAADTIIIGVSKDTCEKHRKFIDKRTLKVQLLADTTGTICELYGVWGEKKFMGKTYMGINRTTFIIDKSGNLIAQYLKVKAKGHAQTILNFIQTH